jgi:hypothetical protein
MVNVVTLNYENSLDRFISEEIKMLYIKRSRLKSLLDGWVDGWMEGKAGLRIAYSNQKLSFRISNPN